MDYTVKLEKEEIEAVLNEYIAYDLDFDFEQEYQDEFEVDNYTDDNVNEFKKVLYQNFLQKLQKDKTQTFF